MIEAVTRAAQAPLFTDVLAHALPGLAALAALAVCLDMVFGDPHFLPHPVRLIGSLYDRLERTARERYADSPAHMRAAGRRAVILVAGTSGLVAYALARLPFAGEILALYLAYAGLALGGLLHESRKAAGLIATARQENPYGAASADLDAARRAVGGLVSRDASAMDADALSRALAETLSENLCDAFVAPFLYLLLGGPGGLWAYKAVSTADSMWGYKTDEYADLGRAAARADDVLAWVPARYAALAMVFGGWLFGMPGFGKAGRSFSQVWQGVRAQARTTASPNAGWTMSAAAWIMNRQLGGSAVYFGRSMDKPLLGPDPVAMSDTDADASSPDTSDSEETHDTTPGTADTPAVLPGWSDADLAALRGVTLFAGLLCAAVPAVAALWGFLLLG